MNIFAWGLFFLAAGIVFTIFILGIPLFIRAPKNQPTIIRMVGLILSFCIFAITTTILLHQTEYFDGGIVTPVYRSLAFLMAPVTLICIFLQILFIRSIRQSVIDYKFLIIFLVMVILFSIAAVLLNQYITPYGASNFNSQFLITLLRGIAFAGLMLWFFYETRKTLKNKKNFILSLILVISVIFLLQTLAGLIHIVTDFFINQSPSSLEADLAGLDLNFRMIRLGIFCTFEVLLTIYWVQHYSLNAIEEREKQEKIQELLLEKDMLIKKLSNSSTLIESGALSAGLAHELNQFLGRIALNRDEVMQLISQPGLKLDDLKLPLDNILKANDSAADLISSLRKLFNRGEDDSTLCFVDELVKDVVILYASRIQKSHIEITLDLQVSERTYIWESLFRQVIANLLSNAIEALDGTVQSNKTIRIESSVDGNGDYCLIISDSGPGIDPQLESKIFNLFASTKFSGTGIGLWLSRYIVERHKGSLTYRNLPDNAGVSFTIIVPMGVKKRIRG